MLKYKIKIIEHSRLPRNMTMKFGSTLAFEDFCLKHVIGSVVCNNNQPVLLCTTNILH